jgi:hypothetical protein
MPEVRSSSEVQAWRLAVPSSSPNWTTPLVRLPRPAEYYLSSLAPVLLRRSPPALDHVRSGFRVFTMQAPEQQLACSRVPLMSFGSSSEAAQAPSRCTTLVSLGAAPPLRFNPLQRLPARSSGMNWPGLQTLPPAPSGFLNLLAPSSAPSLPALFHAGSALGFTLQSFIPHTQRYVVSNASPLLAFAPPSGFFSARESATRISGLD